MRSVLRWAGILSNPASIRVERHLAGVEPRIEIQVEATGAGTDPEARELLDNLPRLNDALSRAEPQLRRRVFDAFRLSVATDHKAGQIRLKALVSSAFAKARDLVGLVANGR